jgi:hypothetical protein
MVKKEIYWPDTGKLSFEIEDDQSVSVRYFPSEKAIIEATDKCLFCDSRASKSQVHNSI